MNTLPIEMMMNPSNINVLLDILSDGIEYSCRVGYWGEVKTYKWKHWYICDSNNQLIFPCSPSPDLTLDTTLIEIRDNEDGEADIQNREWVPITLRNLVASLNWAIETYPHLFDVSCIDNEIIDLEYDAEGSDVILQKIVLGDAIYG